LQNKRKRKGKGKLTIYYGVNEEEEEEGNETGFGEGEVARGHACWRTNREQVSGFFGFWLALGRVGPCDRRHGPCRLSWLLGFNFFLFFLILDSHLQNKIKQHKTKKIKAIKLVGCLPRNTRLKSLA